MVDTKVGTTLNLSQFPNTLLKNSTFERSPCRQQPRNKDRNAAVVRRVAGRSGAKLVDLRTVFTRYLQTHNPCNLAKGILTTDSVHLTPAGNKLVAEALFPALF